MEADPRASGPAAGGAGRTGQRHRLARFTSEQFQRMHGRRAVMARYRVRTAYGQRSGNLHGVFARRVTCLLGDNLSRGEHAVGQPTPSSPPNQAAKLPPRYPRGRKLGRGHHPR
jgi:hypothetical protein